MANKISLFWTFLLILSYILLLAPISASEANQKAYIVYLGDKPKGDYSATSVHMRMLQDVMGSNASTSLLFSYKRSFNGFVARLTEEEMQKLAEMDGVVSVFPSEKKKLHTTRSWDFMGFPQQVPRATIESDIIIGMLDTGIWPESASFSDKGFGPPPSKWKGSCQTSANFTCNNKIIGARYYRTDRKFGNHDFQSPRDSEGHGTHTSSIAAGGLVNMASLEGLALGTARGGVPSARIAVYKICWSDGCYGADILAGFDDAIADGVDIISVSAGGNFPLDYFKDVFAIGAYHAMKHGILASMSAGNEGPIPGTLTNFAPWCLSVAASTIDRKFFTNVLLGNGKIYEGVSLNTFERKDEYPLVYAGDVPNVHQGFNSSESRLCSNNSLDQNLVKDKIVLCDGLIIGVEPLQVGAAGMITRDGGFKDWAFASPLPTSHLSLFHGREVIEYIRSTSNATATILKSFTEDDAVAPYVISFSSCGPNPITPDLLKPDLAAPGVDILAAWSLVSSVSQVEGDNRMVPYNIDSGTSMACPHATAAAAYVKSFHPTWSPAAIRSALMTSAYVMTSATNPLAEFAYGAGHINPLRAVNQGLIYDVGEADYVAFLCGQGYSTKHVRLITGDSTSCSETTKISVWDLNYPSFALSMPRFKPFYRSYKRTVTNVGSPSSTYQAFVTAPPELEIKVEPSVLSFASLGQKLSFVVIIRGTIATTPVSAVLIWYNGEQVVRSPIIVYDSA